MSECPLNYEKESNRGNDFRHFLKEEGLLEEVEELAMKKALAIELEKLIARNQMTKTEMAVRMKTSRAVVDRLLDASNSSMTLSTLGKAARALGRKIKIELVPA
ncbi:MAG TPA: helix-turn-helix transcriptional regulator [Verrucomicrobiae bacterium]|jgi:predicted XRE-type DNA-binding protein|nr:helix-turn-helix transcriptional regulator [Verrucomicrobiae bacterium]